MKQLLTILLLVLLTSTMSLAQYQYHESSIGDSVLYNNDRFTISDDGNWAIRANNQATVNGKTFAGWAEIYKRNADNWQLFQTLTSPDPINGYLFGGISQISNSTMVIYESDRATTETGYDSRLHTYNFNTSNQKWELASTMVGLYISTLDLHNGNLLAVGYNGDNTHENGYVTIYNLIDNNWVEKALFSHYNYDDGFGSSLAITENHLLVGAYADGSASGRGKAYLYNYESDNWIFNDSIFSPTPKYSQGFGYSVDINDEYFAVGTTGPAPDSVYYAYLYEIDGSRGPSLEESLYSVENSKSSGFGRSVSLNDSKLLVGAPYENHDDEGAISAGYQTGSAFLYKIFSYKVELEHEFYQPVLNGRGYFFGNKVILNNNYLAIIPSFYQGEMFIYSGHGENILLSMGSARVVPELTDTILVDVFIHIPQGEEISSAQLPIYLDMPISSGTIVGFETEGTLVGDNNWIAEINKNVTAYNTAFAGSFPIYGFGKFITLKIVIEDGIKNYNFPIEFSEVSPLIFGDGYGYTLAFLDGFIQIEHALVGDVDLNKHVQALDASKVLQYLSYYESFNQLQMYNADASANDTISAFDASLILRYIVGSVDALPYVETIPAAGDVIITNAEIAANKIMTLPIDITNGKNIYSFESSVLYDKDVLKFEGFEASDDLSNYIIEVKDGVGSLKVIAASTKSSITEGSFFNIKFSLIDELTEGSTTVEMTQLRLNENPILKNVGSSVFSIVTDIDDEILNLPKEFSLNQNYPNPFNPTTVISYALPETSEVKVAIFNSLGEVVQELVSSSQSAGTYKYNWNAANMSSGIYFVRISAQGSSTGKNFVDVSKMMLIK